MLYVLICIKFFPESPRWLMKEGQEEESRNVLKAIRDGGVEDELKGINKVVKFELETSTTNHFWVMLFPKDRYSRQSLLLGLLWVSFKT